MSTPKSTRGKVTIWFPVDPERERTDLIENFARMPEMGTYYAERCDERLREQGYRVNSDDLEKLRELCKRFEREYLELARGMRIEPCGGGNVLPANVTPIRRC